MQVDQFRAQYASAVGDLTAAATAALSRSECDAIELHFLKLLRATMAHGVRRFAAGQALVVCRVLRSKAQTDGLARWMDAEVVQAGAQPWSALHTLRVRGASAAGGDETVDMVLTPFNHDPREVALAAFEEIKSQHLQQMATQHSHVIDALSGASLDVKKHCVPLDILMPQEAKADSTELGGESGQAIDADGEGSTAVMAVEETFVKEPSEDISGTTSPYMSHPIQNVSEIVSLCEV